ncbi:hypothetical protein CLE01_32940 [Cryobacterium levicorallinum]|nr:hypothetical protein CLE01_32940 [Cryobacterium levicorallinum]
MHGMPGGLGMNGENGEKQRGESEQGDERRQRGGCKDPLCRAIPCHFTYFITYSQD